MSNIPENTNLVNEHADDDDTEADDVSDTFDEIFRSVGEKEFQWPVRQRGIQDNVTVLEINGDEARFKDKYANIWALQRRDQGSIAHAAIEKSRRNTKVSNLLRFIVQEYPKILEMRDENNRTPLHYAIHKGSSKMIQLICESTDNPSGLIKAETIKGNCLHAAISKPINAKKIGEEWFPTLELLVKSSNSEIILSADHEGNTPLHLALDPRCFINLSSNLCLIELLVEKGPEALKMRNTHKKSKTPFLYLKQNMEVHKEDTQDLQSIKVDAPSPNNSEPNQSSKNKAKDKKKLLLNPDEIRKIFTAIESWLKKYILRSFTHTEALELLYGPILDTAIKKLPKRKESKSPTHYEEIFKWLKEEGVEEVFEVIIEDDLKIPHEDETIIRTLKGFNVEIWNWRKYDISIDTIAEAAPGVEIVYLYTYGNNAVLRGWSDETGLRILSKLQRVILNVNAHNTPPISKYVEDFIIRINNLVDRDNKYRYLSKSSLQNLITTCNDRLRLEDLQNSAEVAYKSASEKRDIEIKVKWLKDEERVGAPQRLKGQTRDQLKANKWFDCVNKASKWVQNSGHINENQHIKIALIDDGVDASHWTLNGRIKEGITYCSSSSANSHIPSSFYSSSTGHGTLMATLICDICPHAMLYVAKLDDRNSSGDFHFTAKSAADAIKWAIGKNVDIISMSWTIEKSINDEDNITELNNALVNAAEKGILLFCAARDEGLENPMLRPYPAASTTKNIFVVGAAGPSGAISTWVSMASIDLLFPGLEIKEACADRMPADISAADGSSTATACASGLAGLLLTILSGELAGNAGWKKSNIYEKMANIMANIAGQTKYLPIWELFDGYISSDEGDIDYFRRLVATLVERSRIQRPPKPTA